MKVQLVPFFSNLKSGYSNTFNVKVIIRILSTLRENGRVNRTNLAGKSGLNYNKCIRYVNLLQVLGWVEVIFDDGYFVIVTEKGVQIIESLTGIK
jgi:predicted transcriptional regulator